MYEHLYVLILFYEKVTSPSLQPPISSDISMMFRVQEIIFLLLLVLKFTSFQDTPCPRARIAVEPDGTGWSHQD
jgi:hypothetical protein